ncbi:hypothetical protein DPMN_077925 [Dreissena polymorpha]|uniref:Uncharacterized protein n=1 Tax=Dreissena polymorpha TaxID=45954 RepID=A0A9D3YRJ0_DREPO|nr:hypothetical protein DPMN_077925 [Dreissena polymorpha]
MSKVFACVCKTDVPSYNGGEAAASLPSLPTVAIVNVILSNLNTLFSNKSKVLYCEWFKLLANLLLPCDTT